MSKKKVVKASLERAIMTTRKGENATVTVNSDFWSGNEFDFNESVFFIEVELVDFTKVALICIGVAEIFGLLSFIFEFIVC
ncbi:peptidylprolyl isomerase [Sarracenia purpurea var. burkii]